MITQIQGAPAFAYVEVDLEPGESIVAESDAMASMDADLEMRVSTNGGFFTALLRKILGGETFFINRFENNSSDLRHLKLVQPTPGDIRCLKLKGDSFYLQPGAFLACTEGIDLGLKWAGFTSWIAREGLFRIQVSGKGKVFYGAYGGLLEREVDGEFIVDTSHLVAYSPGIELKLQLAGGIFSSFFGGEGLVTRVSGKGKVIIQTRSLSGLASWANNKF